VWRTAIECLLHVHVELGEVVDEARALERVDHAPVEEGGLEVGEDAARVEGDADERLRAGVLGERARIPGNVSTWRSKPHTCARRGAAKICVRGLGARRRALSGWLRARVLSSAPPPRRRSRSSTSFM
jgi:hypothetical protein